MRVAGAATSTHAFNKLRDIALILDLYSRKIVGWEVHATDDSAHAAHLVRRTALAESIATTLSKSVLHGDNGATLKATTALGMQYWLGVKPSYSLPGARQRLCGVVVPHGQVPP